ncbi:hypothetical protein ACIQMV_08940 [Streptomyces sp. NPDC091412]|uniref:hypothetical protein n=1 Tax=Streptomyces sp. NPDC091412 TaxID=3366002 RepID=UPI0037FE3C41
MRVRATAATAAMLLAALTACGGNGSDKDDAAAKPKPAASKPAESAAGTGGDGTDGMATGLKFGESYTWPDGLKVTVTEARLFTDWDPEAYESPSPGVVEFRVKLRLENTGQAPADLGQLSTIVEGAASGGRAASSQFERGSEPLEGQLAPGVSVTKSDDNALETRYGRKILVRVQRASENGEFEFPEFTGTITG